MIPTPFDLSFFSNGKTMIFCLGLLVSISFTTPTQAAAAPLTVKLCTEDIDVFPWVLTDSGLVQVQLKILGKETKYNFELVRLPWRRCQQLAINGKFDGIIPASFTNQRTQWGIYPQHKDGKLNPEYSLHRDRYVVFTLADNPVSWKDEAFQNADNRIVGLQRGYSPEEKVDRYNVKKSTSYTSTLDVLEALHRKEIDVAIVQNYSSQKALSLNKRLQKNIKRHDQSFIEMDQYILFTKAFYSNNKEATEHIWKTIKKSKNHPDYKKAQKELLNNYLH